jgi:hypothetical protein
MSNNKRARTRAIRAEMITSGTSYTRAARTAAVRAGRNLRAVCFTCREDIPDRGGVIHVRHRDVHEVEQAQAAAATRRAAKVAAEGRTGFAAETYDWEDLMDEYSAGSAAWQVHCNDCNAHKADDCTGCYWIAVERCRTWSQLVEWTVHLSEKTWVLEATNWMGFIRTAAHGRSQVGLVCDPADRYQES